MRQPHGSVYGKQPCGNNVSAKQAHETSATSERGFALLLVLLMAAAVAFSLYTQLPRVGFESMREKEQLLMDRGNQYKRAIQVFYAVNHRYPSKIEELENTNEKRFLRRRYKDPMTGKDEWRLIHTNGSFLTDSLVQKPPAQNGANGTPGTGILPGGGPLGTNNMNSQPGQGTAAGQGNALGLFGNNAAGGNNATNPDGTPQAPALNPAAQRRPSDRLIPGDGTTAAAVNPQQDPGATVVYPPGYNPATFNPNDPSTWPPISLAPVNSGQPGQNGQPVQPGQLPQNGQPVQPGQPTGIPGFGGQNTLTGQPPATQITPQPFGPTQPFGAQPFPPTVPGQQPVPGQPYVGGTQTTPLPFGPQQTSSSDGSVGSQPLPGQTNTVPPQTPSAIPGQYPGQGGANPQPAQIFNPGFGFNGNPLATDSGQQPAGSPAPNPFGNQPSGNPQTGNQAGQQNPAALNPALQAINGQLSSPGGTPAATANPQAAPGIAGVASKFEGVGIKIYHERSKYKEWEFVFDPAAAGAANQPAPGQNPAGQPGQAGATPSGASGNLFGQTPNPFAPNSGQTQNSSGPTSTPSVPATNPFAPAPGPFGQ
jgi:hypothetical protein